MSHIVETTAEIESLEVLIFAAGLMGLEVERNAVPRFYFTGRGPYADEAKECDIVLKLPGKYDLGVRKEGNQYVWHCDSELLRGGFGAGSPGRLILGENAETLMTKYGEANVELMLTNAGVPFTTARDAEGNIQFLTVDPSEAGYAA